ncbi:hypothetical protein CHS0354_013707 [Potamilus streckersoni]|uniref:CCHC-type domain-containing protein n=1 Tax=Potamilus streckersoni TaxID=2493646 RepID=A0AAE0SZ35_9BIVA|nr:hypothetical protein CHS0354_013707 [Potamilus streckersoni]
MGKIIVLPLRQGNKPIYGNNRAFEFRGCQYYRQCNICGTTGHIPIDCLNQTSTITSNTAPKTYAAAVSNEMMGKSYKQYPSQNQNRQ